MPLKKAVSRSSKKRRVEEHESHIVPTFVNQEAAAFYQDSCIRREGIRERGLHTSYFDIEEVIDHMKWRTFTAHPGAAVVPVIREFYANAKVQYTENPSELKALVRGKMVPYDRHSINQVYELDDIEEDDYSAWSAQGPDFDAVIKLLARKGSTWKTKNDKILSFKRGELKYISLAWHHFISAKLLPTTHLSDVQKERAMLNYALQTRMSIDVGKIIEGSIISFIMGRPTGGLGHPSLIYELCIRSGVQTSAKEELQHPLPMINDIVMNTFLKATRKHKSSKTSASGSSQPSSSHQEPPISEPTLMDLQEQVRELRDYVEKSEKQRLAEQRQQFQYFVDYTNALNNMFHNCSLSQGASSVVFPTPPTFPPASPPTDTSGYESDD